MEKLCQWMYDVAFEYFNSYYQNIKYLKDRMVVRGNETCHEIFLWLD